MNKIFNTQATLLREAKFEDHNMNKCLLSPTPVTFELNLKNDYNVLKEEDGLFNVDVVLTISSYENKGTNEAPEKGEPIYTATTKYSGLFILQGFSPEELEIVLNVNCPSFVFPYARAEINRMVSETQMSKPVLQPVSFEQTYQMKKQQEAKKKEESND